ncbi:MAG: TetR/AcrR family transcriptional regulator [Desulfobacterales bacterium]|nr:TetR/AcrR family transcriptional regulator [Desulfobacterales bacterium]
MNDDMENRPSNKKEKIIEAAVGIFAEKGFNATTISDLAKTAHVGEATIYNHFENKLEILLSLIVPYGNDFISGFHEHLRGLKDPEEKLRRFIWFTLKWCQQHRNCTKILLVDIISLPQFYQSEGYALLRKASFLPLDFLDEGIERGMFRVDTNKDMFHRLVFGILLYVVLNRIMLNRSFELLDHFDDIANVILSCVKAGQTDSPVGFTKKNDKRERILLAGEMLFSRKPSGETTIAEIAHAARVADGTIYDYFKNKEELLFRIFNHRMKDFLTTFNETISPKRSISKLKMGVYHFLWWVQNNQSWAKVYIKDIVSNPRFYQSSLYKFKLKHDQALLELFEEGVEAGDLNSSLTSDIFLSVIFGPIHIICLPWAILDHSDSLTAHLDDLFELINRILRNPDPVNRGGAS